jgi:hypothetical protein
VTANAYYNPLDLHTPTIAPAILPALEQLERATSPVDLGPAYAEVVQEGRRISTGWPLLEFATVLRGVAYVLCFLLMGNFPLLLNGGVLLLVAVSFFVSQYIEQSPPGRSLARLGNATQRWMHAIPAMRESPDLILKDAHHEPA